MWFIVPILPRKITRKIIEEFSYLEAQGLIAETPDGEIAVRIIGNLYIDGKQRIWERYERELGYEMYRRKDIEQLRKKYLDTLRRIKQAYPM